MIKFSELFLRSLYGNTVVILDPCTDIHETLGVSLLNLSFLNFISFGCFFLVFLSDKLADEIEYKVHIWILDRKICTVDGIIDEKNIIKKTPPPCKNKQDYVGGNNDKTRDDDDYPSDTDSCARNLDDEHKNEEDDEYIEPPSEENYRIKSKISEGITEEYFIISLSDKYFHTD